MLHLRAHPRFHFREHLKMHKYVKKKMHFIRLQLMIHLILQSRGTPDGTLDGAPKNTLIDLHKDAQESAFEVALKGGPMLEIELDMWLHLLMQSLIHKCKQSGSSNGGPDAGLKGALHVGLNVGLEWGTLLDFSLKAIEDAQ